MKLNQVSTFLGKDQPDIFSFSRVQEVIRYLAVVGNSYSGYGLFLLQNEFYQKVAKSTFS